MRIYLSSRFGRQEELCGYARELRGMGHEITSSWLTSPRDLPADAGVEACGRVALDDLKDLLRSDCLIAFTESPEPRSGGQRGGRHVEVGIALALMAPPVDHFKHLIVVGHRENVFYCLPRVEFFSTWSACLEALR